MYIYIIAIRINNFWSVWSVWSNEFNQTSFLFFRHHNYFFHIPKIIMFAFYALGWASIWFHDPLFFAFLISKYLWHNVPEISVNICKWRWKNAKHKKCHTTTRNEKPIQIFCKFIMHVLSRECVYCVYYQTMIKNIWYLLTFWYHFSFSTNSILMAKYMWNWKKPEFLVNIGVKSISFDIGKHQWSKCHS